MSFLADAIRRVWEAARADDKTPLMNALAMREHAEEILGTLANPYLIVFGDINRFKTLNDQHGHAAGDAAIFVVGTTVKQIAEACQATAFRQSGDEFVVLLPSGMLDTFRSAVKQRFLTSAVTHERKTIPISISFGYVAPGTDDFPSLLKKAEAACRLAKLRGPGELVEWTEEVAEKLPIHHRVHCDSCKTQFDCSIPREAKSDELRCPNCNKQIGFG